MKEKVVLSSIVLFLILIIGGGYFAYSAIFTEASSNAEENHLQEKYNLNKNSESAKSENAHGKSEAEKKELDLRNKSSGSAVSKNLSNENRKLGANNNEMVVDQTLQSTVVKGEDGKIIGNVLGSVKEKIDIEILLADGEVNKTLANYDVEIKYKYNNDSLKSERFTSNQDGKFIFKTTQTGFLNFQLFTKDFSIHSKYLVVRYGKNEYKAKLYKGGTLEVKATNMDNKVVEGLAVKLGSGFRGRQSQDSIPLELDANRGVYFIPNVPVGTQDVSFKATGYLETTQYKILVETKNPVLLELKMQKARTLFFDLDIKTKPDVIYISNRRMNNNRGRNVVQRDNFGRNNNVNEVATISSSNSQTELPLTTTGTDQVVTQVPNNRGRNNNNNDNSNNQRSNFGRNNSNFYSNNSEAFLNKSGLYEFELDNRNTTSLTLLVDKYIPQEVNLEPDKDTYRLSLVEGYVAEINVNNEKGEPVIGAKINYSSGQLRQTAVTDDNGFAQLTGLTGNMAIRLNVTEKNYVPFNENWAYDSIEQNSKIIVLVEGAGISGKIKFNVLGNIIQQEQVLAKNEQIVMGAKVQLYQSGRNYPIAKTDSESDGSYFFENLDSKSEKEYYIKAFHREFGSATSATFKFTGKKSDVDLTLLEEKSLNLKLVDSKGEPLPNKNITIMNGVDSEFSLSVMTDEKGEYKFVNLIHGYYYIRLEDDDLKLKNRNIQIPAGDVTVTAESKNLKKINVTVLGGKAYKGFLKVSVEMHRSSWPMDVITGEDGNYYLEFREEHPMRFGTFLFEAQGYAVVRMGPYEKAENMPKEFNVELHEGENIKVKVLDDKNNKPMAFISVDIVSGNTKIQSLPTNELGEILFTHVSGNFSIAVKEDGFADYKGEFEGTKIKEITIKLIRGGGLKGQLTVGKEVANAWISLQPGGINMPLDSSGKFEFFNLLPGEYELSVSRSLKDGKNQMEKIPVRIIIENEKIFEINLDDFQKNQTTLDVTVYKDGVITNESGFLNITDRRGQSVVATTVNNGKHLVERILPGEYLLSYNYQGKALQKTLGVLPRQSNLVDIYVPGSSLTITVKNEEGDIIPKAMITLYAGEKYRQEDSFLGNQIVTAGTGVGTFLLMPKSPYYFVVEEDFRFNYQVNVIGPIILEAGQATSMEVILPYARKLSKIQVTDNANNPLADVGFIFNDESGNFFQRTLKKEWDLYPYSNKQGFLPENCWPKGNFTLIVGKEGYEFKEILIPADFDPQQPLQIKLNKASSIRCSFPTALSLPISVGVLNRNGVLLQKPIPLSNRKKNELTVYFENITFGSVNFNDLAAGEYYIGFYWNGSSRLISKQGPYKLGVEENLSVTSTLQVSEY